MAGENTRVAVVFIGVLIWSTIIRLPYAHVAAFDGDEALFWIIGSAWHGGHPPYTEFWDVKPPGIFLIFSTLSCIFGNNIVGAKLLAILAVSLASTGIFVFGDRFLKDRLYGLIAAIIFPAYTLVLDGLSSKPEIFIAPFIIWGVLLAVIATRKEAVNCAALMAISGFLIGCAGSIKQTVVFEAIFVISYLWYTKRSVRALIPFFLGLMVAPLGFCLYFSYFGLFPTMVQASVFGAVGRLKGDGISLTALPIQFLATLKPLLPLLICGSLLWVERRRFNLLTARLGLLVVVLWLGSASAAALAMRVAYPAYVLPLLAPLTLAAGCLLGYLLRAGSWQRNVATAGLVIVLAYPFAFFQLSDNYAIAPSRLPQDIADYVRSIAPRQSIYVVDYEPVVYLLANAPIPTRYPLPQHLLCNFPPLPVSAPDEIARIMASRPAALVLSTNRKRMACEISDRATLALRLGGDKYYLGQRFTNAFDSIEVWRRR